MNATRPQKSTTPEEVPNIHWADHVAEELIARHPNKKPIVCASGISPSGVVHIGNFREVVTVEFVVRALLDRGREVRFIYSWDDYDAFRKVPANLPNQDVLAKHLRKPISRVPDPLGDLPSYAARFEKIFENEISLLGIQPEYIYQNVPYERGDYADGIRTALANQPKIANVLNASRTEPLPPDWTALSIFCDHCYKDTTELKAFTPPTQIDYHCHSCKKDVTAHLGKGARAKLLWRVDWPMRWAKEGVDFEPGGKDHSSQGGSYDTGCGIIREVWKQEPPHYVQYDFVLAKGLGSKLSSSSGNLITLGEALQIYEPAVIRWIFASRKPNIDFSIAFDLDVMKAYDDYDRCERFAYGVEAGEERKVRYERRIYEFSALERRSQTAYGPMPAQFPFRHLCNILQIHQGSVDKAKAYFSASIHTPADEARLVARSERAWKWITTFAPEEFRFQLRGDSNPPGKSKFPAATQGVLDLLRGGLLDNPSEDDIASQIFQVMKGNGLDAKTFFGDIYQTLIGKGNGPKLASFLKAIGKEKAVALLSQAL